MREKWAEAENETAHLWPSGPFGAEAWLVPRADEKTADRMVVVLRNLFFRRPLVAPCAKNWNTVEQLSTQIFLAYGFGLLDLW